MPAPEQNFIMPSPPASITFGLEPAFNAVHSLILLNKVENLSGLGEWVIRTAAQLTPEEKQRHRLVTIGLHYVIIPEQSWPSFPAYLDYLAATDPVVLQDKLLNAYARISPDDKTCMDISSTPEPVDKAAVLRSVDTFLEFLWSRFHAQNIDVNIETEAYTYIINPPAMKARVITHLRHMWDKYLAPEWEQIQPMLRDSVEAFRQVDVSQMSRLEVAQWVTGQELDAQWEQSLSQVRQVMFVPSAHVGPYIGRFRTPNRLGILYGARLPEGTRVHAPDLSRAEILVRLTALADDSRLRILRLIAEQGELRSQDVMHQLDLSQSAASRHLKQLTATGYLAERRCEGAKCYRLHPQRIESTLQAVAAFLTGS